MTTLSAVCTAHAALAMAEFDGATPEIIQQLTAVRDAAEQQHRAAMDEEAVESKQEANT